MKIFAEINSTDKEIQQNFKVEVKDIQEAKEKIIEDESNWDGLKYQKRIHYCFHDEKTNKPCEIQLL